MPAITVTSLPDGRKTLSGGTYDYKEAIKAASKAAGVAAAWDPATKSWTVAAGTDLSFLPTPAPPPPKPQPAAVYRPPFRSRIGQCCAAGVFKLDPWNPQGPMVCHCTTHGSNKSNYAGD